MNELNQKRENLVVAVYNTYDPDNFPGSRAWRANVVAQQSLDNFDADHPEVLTAIEAEQAAERKAEIEEIGVEKMMGM